MRGLIATGLVFDVVGVILIWRFGLPAHISRTGVYVLGSPEDMDPGHLKREAIYLRLTRIGLGLVLIGFILQLIGIL
jgi:hypothetical protein